MLEITMESSDFEEAAQVLEGWAREERLREVMQDLLDRTVKVMEDYPPEKRLTRKEAGQEPFTEKQRGWFFNALKNGFIDVPYRRTDQMKDFWKTEVTVWGSSATGRVWTDVDYAKYVRGTHEQNLMMMMIGWRPLEYVAKDMQEWMEGRMQREAEEEARYLDRALAQVKFYKHEGG